MPIRRSLAAMILLLGLLNATASASVRGPWDIVSKSAAENQNVVVSTILKPEMQAALLGKPYPKRVLTNCHESGLPSGIRIFVSDLYFPKGSNGNGAGENCLLHRYGNLFVTAFATLNSAWSPIHVLGVRPSPFFARGKTLSVPTLHLFGAAKLAGRRTEVLQLGLQDSRYGVLLFPNTASVASIEQAVQEILSPPYTSGLDSGQLQAIDLQIPLFAVRTGVRSDDLPGAAGRAIKLVTLLTVNPSGVGNVTNWPPLLHGGLRNVSSAPTVSIVLNRPFFFAIVRYDTRSLIFAGYLARPMLRERPRQREFSRILR